METAMQQQPQPTYLMNVQGGLGNQLFQVYALLAFSLRHPGIPCHFLDYQFGPRPHHWNHFLKNVKQMVIKKPVLNQCRMYMEPRFRYDEWPIPDTTMMVSGYFQSPLYFADCRDPIDDLLGVEAHRNRLRSMFPVVSGRVTCMHFRLGDYKKLPNHHPILPVEYYKEAMRTMDNATVMYFCEEEDRAFVDNERIRPLQERFPNVTWIHGPSQGPFADWEEMLFMSLCDDFVIANSTFSWWAAYCNTATEKRVLYPSVWFGDALKQHDTRDLFPPSWECIRI